MNKLISEYSRKLVRIKTFARSLMSCRPWQTHLIGLLATCLGSIILVLTVVPYAAHNLFTPPLSGYNRTRLELFYYLTLALIPALLWLIPSFIRALSRAAYNAHKILFGRSGFYVRYPTQISPKFRTTLLLSLGPFAVDLLAIVEIEHFVGDIPNKTNSHAFYIAPVFFLLAAVLTGLIPGAWMINELGLRLLNPKTGEVIRASAIFDGILGPLGTFALLVSFITTLSGSNYSYEQAAFALAVWAIRLYPPVLAAVTVYRLYIEPRVLPGLERWCDQQNIPVEHDLTKTLEAMRPTSDVRHV